jgi:hypothetical protein
VGVGRNSNCLSLGSSKDASGLAATKVFVLAIP